MKVTKHSSLLRRITLLLVAVLLCGALLPTLTACADTAMTLDGASIDSEMYAFWFSMSKTDVMRRYGIKSSQDTEAFWSSVCQLDGAEGRTWGEIVNDEVQRAVKTKIAAALLYDEMGLTMTSSQKKKIKSYLSDMIEYVADGDKSALKEKLAAYGTSYKAMKRCAAYDLRAELVLSYLSRNGKTELTAEEKAGYYADNYYRVKVLYVNKEVYGAYENGVRVEKPLGFTGPGARNDQDKAELAAILDVYNDNGTLPDNFEAAFEEYLERSDEALHVADVYPDGLYVTRNLNLADGGLLEADVFEAARGLKPGQIEHVETELGDRYIYCYALDTGAYDNDKYAPFFSTFYSGAASRALSARAATRIADFVEYAEAYNEISVYTVPCNLEFRLCSVE